MAFLLKTDLTTHLYEEILDEISRKNDTIITARIQSGIAEVKSYLSRYDLLKLFGDTVTEKVIDDPNLVDVVKDVVCWHLIKLANPNIDIELFKLAYDNRIKWLTLVQAGKCVPEDWPYKADDPDTDVNENNSIQYTTNRKRNQHL